MSTPNVTVVAQGVEYAIETPYQVIPAGQVVLAVTGARSKNVRLDGRDVRLTGTKPGLLALDLTRSTGFHHLRVDGTDHWFGTEDAKLKLAGIEAMLLELATLGTGWTGQALFSNGGGLRDSHVVYAWLDIHAEEALRTVAQILAQPRPRVEVARRLQRRGGPGVLVAPTLRLLRSRPREYLAESSTGVLTVDGKAYDPLRVVARTRRSTLDTVANRRAIAVAQWIARLAGEVLDDGVDATARVPLTLWRNGANALLATPLGQTLSIGRPLAPGRQPEEITDHRYRRTFDLHEDMTGRFGWSATTKLTSRLSYVQQSDVIYQAYVASRIAKVLHLTQTDGLLGCTPLAFTGPNFDLYYDTTPPADVLRSWRYGTDTPDDSRPDLLLVERSTGKVAVVDAKYRVRFDRATEDSRKEVSAYLSLYGLHAATIAFPGSAAAQRDVAGKDMTLIEAPIGPGVADIQESIDAILLTLELPPY